MQILYVASQSPHGTGAHRLSAIRRLGHHAVPFGTDTVDDRGTRVTKWLRYRTMVGSAIRSFNHRLIDAVSAQHFDLVWFDKPVYVWPRTVQALRRTGAFVVSYNPDNPYGLRRDPGWRLFLKSLPEFDIHLVPRQSNVSDYQNAGAARVFVMPFSFEPPLHFPPPAGWSDAERIHDVGFVGSPYDDRADFIRALWRRHHIMVRVRGSRWERVLTSREKCCSTKGARFMARATARPSGAPGSIWAS